VILALHQAGFRILSRRAVKGPPKNILSSQTLSLPAYRYFVVSISFGFFSFLSYHYRADFGASSVNSRNTSACDLQSGWPCLEEALKECAFFSSFCLPPAVFSSLAGHLFRFALAQPMKGQLKPSNSQACIGRLHCNNISFEKKRWNVHCLPAWERARGCVGWGVELCSRSHLPAGPRPCEQLISEYGTGVGGARREIALLVLPAYAHAVWVPFRRERLQESEGRFTRSIKISGTPCSVSRYARAHFCPRNLNVRRN
jgi:hypothetical protein